MKVLAISSSIRQASKSNQIAKMLQSIHVPRNVSIDTADIDIKLFRSGEEASTQSSDVAKFRHQLHESKAVLFVASEMPMGFPYSVTAPLLNAVNWGTYEANLFKGKSAAFASVDRFIKTDPLFGFDSTLHCPNLYHLRQLASIVGLNCLQSKFDLQAHTHYTEGVEGFDDNQTAAVKNTLTNLVLDLVYFHRFEKKKRKHNIPKHFHLVSPEAFSM